VTASLPESEKVSELQAGGSSYADPAGDYSFLYPNDYTLDTKDPVHIRVYVRGDMQRPQSEMSDGVLIVFESIDLQGKSLESVVDERLQQAVADGTSEIMQPKTALSLNKYPGFTYELKGLGSSTTVLLQKTLQSNQALSVTYIVADPQNKGYQADVDAVLATVKLLK
jgi:hypothetical protein